MKLETEGKVPRCKEKGSRSGDFLAGMPDEETSLPKPTISNRRRCVPPLWTDAYLKHPARSATRSQPTRCHLLEASLRKTWNCARNPSLTGLATHPKEKISHVFDDVPW